MHEKGVELRFHAFWQQSAQVGGALKNKKKVYDSKCVIMGPQRRRARKDKDYPDQTSLSPPIVLLT